MDNRWNELKDSEIIAVLDGDKSLGYENLESKQVELSLPYLSTKDIIYKVGNHFNYFIPYYDKNGKVNSREIVFEILLTNAIKHNQIVEVLDYIFSKRHLRPYIENVLGLEVSYCQKLIPIIQQRALSKINDVLYTKDLFLTTHFRLESRRNASKSINEEKVELRNMKNGFYILPFKKDSEDMMKAIKTAIKSKKTKG